jgi:16S rRNA (guanine527-N7)-methyltransferase
LPDVFKNTFERHGFYVSRETLEKFELYGHLLLKWQKAINLVGPTTLTDVPERHFFDSAQMFRYITNVDCKLADLGSGAGFPGMVLAMLGVKEVHLVESDIRKATFLREVSRETKTPVTIHDVRIEDCQIPDLDVITARALAPLKDLFVHMDGLTTEGHPVYGLFAKGMQHQEEIDKAKKQWEFGLESFASETDLSGKILRVTNLKRK